MEQPQIIGQSRGKPGVVQSSIDERRRPYREYLVERHPRRLEEMWFAGECRLPKRRKPAALTVSQSPM